MSEQEVTPEEPVAAAEETAAAPEAAAEPVAEAAAEPEVVAEAAAEPEVVAEAAAEPEVVAEAAAEPEAVPVAEEPVEEVASEEPENIPPGSDPKDWVLSPFDIRANVGSPGSGMLTLAGGMGPYTYTADGSAAGVQVAQDGFYAVFSTVPLNGSFNVLVTDTSDGATKTFTVPVYISDSVVIS